MARVVLVKDSLEQALMSNILVLITVFIADCWEVVRWALQHRDGEQLRRRGT